MKEIVDLKFEYSTGEMGSVECVWSVECGTARRCRANSTGEMSCVECGIARRCRANLCAGHQRLWIVVCCPSSRSLLIAKRGSSPVSRDMPWSLQ